MIRRAAFTLAAALLAGCNTGSETGNPTKGLSGTIRTLDGLPAARARVTLVPADFNPVDPDRGKGTKPRSDTTDARGRYGFEGVEPGRYNLEAVSLADGTRARLIGVIAVSAADPAMVLPDQALRVPGAIEVDLRGAADTVAGYIYQIGGTARAKVSASSGIVRMDSLPPGPVDSLVYGSASGSIAPRVFAWNLQVTPEAATRASGAYLAWSRSAVIQLEPSTAGLSEGVGPIPLRIPLPAGAFDATDRGGADLRATDEHGRPLACETQGWDAAAPGGALWARLDTVAADRMQMIHVYWDYPGDQPAPGAWAPGSVFSAADGYVAAWHLDGDPFLAGGTLPDQSGGGNPGVAIGYRAAGASSEGIAGNGLEFDGADRFAGSLKAFDNPSIFTFSLWFRTSDTTGGRLIEFASDDTTVNQAFWDRLIHMYADGTVHFGIYPPKIAGTPMPTPSTYKILGGTAHLNDGRWHQVAARLSGQGQALFVDGARIASDPAAIEAQNIRGYWRLGYGKLSDWAPAGTGLYFRGALDEAWIAHADRSDAFIKLSYENLKPGSRLFRTP